MLGNGMLGNASPAVSFRQLLRERLERPRGRPSSGKSSAAYAKGNVPKKEEEKGEQQLHAVVEKFTSILVATFKAAMGDNMPHAVAAVCAAAVTATAAALGHAEAGPSGTAAALGPADAAPTPAPGPAPTPAIATPAPAAVTQAAPCSAAATLKTGEAAPANPTPAIAVAPADTTAAASATSVEVPMAAAPGPTSIPAITNTAAAGPLELIGGAAAGAFPVDLAEYAEEPADRAPKRPKL